MCCDLDNMFNVVQRLSPGPGPALQADNQCLPDDRSAPGCSFFPLNTKMTEHQEDTNTVNSLPRPIGNLHI